MKKYDYIIAGGGCAGLSLTHYLLQNPATAQKKILIVEQDAKEKNDRTWCFWEAGNQNWYETLVAKTWDDLIFFGEKLEKKLNIAPYSYKMIRAIDFYDHFKKSLPNHANVTYKTAGIAQMYEKNGLCYLHTADQEQFSAQYIFSSVRDAEEETNLKKPKDIWYLQHFKGWIVETEQDFFREEQAFFMDFRPEQADREARFGYVLPETKRRALVEYTVFSDAIWAQNDYDLALKNYIETTLNLTEYKILHEEFGVIPMTDSKFAPKKKSNILPVGTAGGYSKPSTGYTFVRIQQFCSQLAQRIAQGKSIHFEAGRQPFLLYDSIFLDVFDKNRCAPKEVFTSLFKKNEAELVLRFLDEKTTLLQNLKIMLSVPILPFTQAALSQIAHKIG